MRSFRIFVFIGTATAVAVSSPKGLPSGLNLPANFVSEYKDFFGGKNVSTPTDSAFHLDPEITDIEAIKAATKTAAHASDSAIIRGCGTIQQSDGNAFPLVGDYTCRERLRIIDGAVVVGKGCTCLFFKDVPGCIQPNSLAYWLVGAERQPIGGGEDVKWYTCGAN